MSGRELAERARALRPETQVLYMSGFTDDAVVRHGVIADDLSFIQKPFSPDGLTKRVREILDGPQVNARSDVRVPADNQTEGQWLPSS